MTAPRKTSLLICFGLAAVVFALYAQVFQYGFIEWDDKSHITENPAVRAGLTPAAIHWVFTHFIASQWIPLSWLSHMVDITVFGLDPGWHHLVNVGYHALNTCLVFLVLLAFTGRRGPSAVVALLFAVHPINVESVVWITERKNVLSTTFWLLAMGAYRRHARHSTGRWMWLTALCMALGMMAKPMLVTLPCALLLLDVWPLRRHLSESWPRLALEKWPLWLLSAASSASALAAAAHDNVLTGAGQLTLQERALNVVAGYAGYLQHLFWPANFSILYPLRSTYPAATVITACLVLAGLTAGCVLVYRRQPQVLVGWLWFIGILVPVSGISQVGAQAYADRFAYIPELGLFWGLVWWLDSLSFSTRPAVRHWKPCLAGLVAMILSLCTLHRVPYWSDTVLLFEDALRVSPPNGIAHAMAGMGWARREDYPQAIAHYRAALRYLPRESHLRVIMASALAHSGNPVEAIEHLRIAVGLRPDDKLARYNLVTLLAQQGHPEEAAKYLPAQSEAIGR